MRRALHAIIVVAFAMGLVACGKDPSTTNAADSLQPRSAPAETLGDDVKPERKAEPKPKAQPRPEPKLETKITVPAGTKLRVALLEAVSSDDSHPGDQFMASLTEPITVEGRTVLAKGTK